MPTRSLLPVTAIGAVSLLAANACVPTEPQPSPLAVNASLGAPANVNSAITIPWRIENVGTVPAYVPYCYSAERLDGRRWVTDVGLSGACNSVPPESIAVGATVERELLLLRSRLPAADSTVLRVTFRVSDDATYEPARTIAVRTTPVTVR